MNLRWMGRDRRVFASCQCAYKVLQRIFAFFSTPLFRSHSLLPKLLLKVSQRLLKVNTHVFFFSESERFCVKLSIFCQTRRPTIRGNSRVWNARKRQISSSCELFRGVLKSFKTQLRADHPVLKRPRADHFLERFVRQLIFQAVFC